MTPALAVDALDPNEEAPPTLPQRIGRFIVREEIGRGSNGIVYSATDPVLGRDVAIKAIPIDGGQPGQEELEAGFLQEAKIAAALNHPSIVTVFDAGRNDSIAYIAMERLKGSDLHHWLASNRPMAPEAAAALIARVADAVHFAHRRGLIHRDIKPSNIFLGRDMKPKVLDFGIALAQGKQGTTDASRKLIGTPNYMSPEQALGRPLDARSDVFSIGAILYELVTGSRAFDGEDTDEILKMVVTTDPPPLSSMRPGIPPALGEIIFRALAKDPAHRFQTAGQLRNALAAFAGRPVPPSTTPVSFAADSPPKAARSLRWHLPGPGALVATGIAVLGLSVTFGIWYWSHRVDADSAEAAASAAVAQSAPAPAPKPVLPPAPPAPVAAPPEPAQPVVKIRPAPRARIAPAPVAPPPPEPGALSIAVAPWGEVFLDGGSIGVSPPLTHVSLSAGKHSIEVRNGSFPPYALQIDVEAGKTLVVQHRF
ncbi:MAG TPA: serine/threonine-protein kinase [Burkholderiaceae bacterium]|nr:serine/threonine-protein kinase [Burkholderiaceae bacterium]